MQFVLNGRNNNIEHPRRAIIGAMRKSGVVYYEDRDPRRCEGERRDGDSVPFYWELFGRRLFETVTPSID